ncbi:MAG: DUF2179 domain-containing protein [Bacilli bacterium]|nr:DUF2179 domain-containing protein [Bacilli bacterium]
MDLILCLFIFVAKVIETALATFRIIIISNGKKFWGAVLSGTIALVWIVTTSMVVLDLAAHPYRAVFLALGCFVGSYLGSLIEEKMAMGSNMMMVISNDVLGPLLYESLRQYKYAVTVTKANGKDSMKYILFMMVPRKERNEISEIIKKIDKDAVIITETAQMINGGYI